MGGATERFQKSGGVYRRAFSLIELLVVVILVAIMLAIALPSNMEYQTRVRYAQAKSDLRELAAATDAYYNDHSIYPFPSNKFGVQQPVGTIFSPPFETRTSVGITSPVSYLKARPFDPFNYSMDPEDIYVYVKSDVLYNDIKDDPLALSKGNALVGVNVEHSEYLYLSVGTSGFGTPFESMIDSNNFPEYDPTNGTASDGIIRMVKRSQPNP
jgi:prepilin-type N-terminal cleavage/methylation domain-containing protein